MSGQQLRPSGANFSIVTGPAVATVTDQTTLKSATYNISGPTFTSGNQLVLPGHQLILLLPENAPPGPGLLFTTGRATITDLKLDVANFKGRSTDVCQALA